MGNPTRFGYSPPELTLLKIRPPKKLKAPEKRAVWPGAGLAGIPGGSGRGFFILGGPAPRHRAGNTPCPLGPVLTSPKPFFVSLPRIQPCYPVLSPPLGVWVLPPPPPPLPKPPTRSPPPAFPPSFGGSPAGWLGAPSVIPSPAIVFWECFFVPTVFVCVPGTRFVPTPPPR